VPAHTTALGKVLLSDRREADILGNLQGAKLHAMTPNTVVTREALIEELRWVKLMGFAIDDQEYAVGLRCVAVPIRDHLGAIVAAISVAVPITRGTAYQLTDALLAIDQGAQGISRRLGCDSALLGLKAGLDRTRLYEVVAERLEGESMSLASKG
jgi:IclR family transcriptional regulator, KDG regulon repressor